MNIVKKAFGKILYGIANTISFLFDMLILIAGFMVNITLSIGRGFLGILSMGGCLFILLIGPALLFNKKIFLSLLFLGIFPILGTKFISYLKYAKYMITEFFYDHGDKFIKGKKTEFDSFNEYGEKYRRIEEEKRRQEQQRRQREEQRMWEERFRQWSEYQNSHMGGSRSSYGGNYVNPNIEFKSKYEKSCDIIGVPYNSDKYEIKLGYRKKAKEYHPDINKATNATEMFQQINNAYEFLSDDNIERYKRI